MAFREALVILLRLVSLLTDMYGTYMYKQERLVRVDRGMCVYMCVCVCVCVCVCLFVCVCVCVCV